MRRTITLRLLPTVEQTEALAETTRLFTLVFNAVVAYGWERRERNSVRLHHATYGPLKAQYPALVSDLHIQARVKATEAVRSAFMLAAKGQRVSIPVSRSCSPRYNHHTFKLDWPASVAVLSTTAGRQRLSFVLPAYFERYKAGKCTTADLVLRGGRWWLHVAVELPAPMVDPSGVVVGVDLGLDCPVVTSNGQFLGQRRWREIEQRRFRLRRALQKRGTKSARRHLRRVRGKERRFRHHTNHVLAKRIVETAGDGSVIVVENLTGIRSRAASRRGRQARRLHSWSFAQLRAFIEYKAEDRGCTVVGVDPRHTSQRCSRCGHTARNNRRSRAWFSCRSCGFELHADLNAARNIAAKYQASVGMADAGGLPVNQPHVGVFSLSAHKPSPRATAVDSNSFA